MVRVLVVTAVAIVLAGAAATNGHGQSANSAAPAASSPTKLPAWGTPSDVAYAKTAWRALVAWRMAGPNRFMAYPVKSEQPHGEVVQVVGGTIKVAGRMTRVVVKNNHRGKDLTPAIVYDEPQKFHANSAVMIKREKGFNPGHGDWFWVVFKPDGSIDTFKGRPIAGRVDTGGSDGCIGCHVKQGGKDFETLTSK